MIIEVENLHAGYDREEVLKGVFLAVHAGEVVALIGPNGSGKSTLFKAICGLLRPVAGEIRFLGRNISELDSERILRLGIAYLPQSLRVFSTLTVDENLDIGGYLLEPKKTVITQKGRIYSRFPVLKEKSNTRAAELSGGQQQILGIARALMLSPKILLLDEPSLGIDPKTFEVVFETIGRLKAEGIATLVIEQNVRSVLSLADRAYLLRAGKIVTEGPPSAIKSEIDRLLS